MPDLGPITLSHLKLADLEPLLAEEPVNGDDAAPAAPELDVEALDAQILAGLVSP